LDETLDAVRALWRGETVTRSGRYVRLEGARVRPLPASGGIPIEGGARRAAEQLAAACAREGRDPDSIGRSLWIFARPGRDPAEPALRQEFLHWNPWYADLPEGDLGES